MAERPERFHELWKPQPTIAASILGDRQVKVVKDIDVKVDEQAVESAGPPLDDLASRASLDSQLPFPTEPIVMSNKAVANPPSGDDVGTMADRRRARGGRNP
jgi:hypothetical protein